MLLRVSPRGLPMTTQYALHDAVRLRRMADRCRYYARQVLRTDIQTGLEELAADLEMMAAEREREPPPDMN